MQACKFAYKNFAQRISNFEDAIKDIEEEEFNIMHGKKWNREKCRSNVRLRWTRHSGR